MKKILTASLVAMMAVTAANADIASTKYVTDITGNKTFTGSVQGSADLTAAVNALAGKIDTVAGEGQGSVAQQITNALSSATATAFSESVQGSLTKANNSVQTTDFEAFKGTNTQAIADAKSGAETTAKGYTDTEVGKVNNALTEYKTSNDAAVKANTDAIAAMDTNYVSEGELTTFKGENTQAIATAKQEAITDAGTAADNMIKALDVTEKTAADGKYFSAYKQEDGKISMTEKEFETGFVADAEGKYTSKNAPSTAAVAEFVTATLGATSDKLDVTIAAAQGTATEALNKAKANADDIAALDDTYVKDTDFASFQTENTQAIATAKSGAETTAKGYADAVEAKVTTLETGKVAQNTAAIEKNAQDIAALDDTYVKDTDFASFQTENTQAIATAKSGAETTAKGYADQAEADANTFTTEKIAEIINAADMSDGTKVLTLKVSAGVKTLGWETIGR